jgi:hypothetical protein
MNKSHLIIFSLGVAAAVISGFWGILVMSAPTVSAAPTAIWYVNASTGDIGNDCLSAGAACATIGDAVAKASGGDSIEIAAGTYNEHDIEIFKELTLTGAGAESTIVDAGENGRLFHAGTTVTISNLTMQNGLTSAGDIFAQGGGAVLFTGDSLTLQNVILKDNYAVGNGGAIFNNGDLLLQNTQVLSNTAAAIGGGIYNYTLGIISVTQSAIMYNTAIGTQGGGIYAGGKALDVQNSTIAYNSATSFGGGILASFNGPTTLDGVTLTGNEAASGAALFSQVGSITATNTTVSGNNATNNYGGFYVSGPDTSLFVQNSTIAENTRTNTAGNGFNGIMRGNNATVSIVNTILADNQENNCASSSAPTSLGHNLSTDFSCGLSQPGDQPGIDPLLGPLADNGGDVATHALMPGSPAIDTGDNAACAATDARDIARPFDGDGDSNADCDIGAVEARHQLSIADSTVLEGDGGTVTAVFTVTLSPASTSTVEVDYTTVNDTASAGSDYTAASNTLTFNPSQTETTISILVTGDTDDEVDETFFVQLSNAVNADLLDGEAVGTIVDNDGLPKLTIGDQTLLEGNSGTKVMEFEVTLSPASASVVTVDYETMPDSALAGSDYTAVNDTLTFQPNETSKTISVDILGDIVDEGVSEAFTVQLSSPSNAALANDLAAGTITDDDQARLRHEYGPHIPEGDSGYTPAVFTVTLSTPADFIVTVDYEVSSGFGDEGAKVGDDFLAAADTLTFQPGETVQTYTVQIVGDTISEADENYSSLISNANVPISVNGSLAQILNDDDNNFSVFLPMIVR